MKHKSVAVSIHLSLVLEIFVCPVEEISVLHVNLQMYDRQAWLAVAYIYIHTIQDVVRECHTVAWGEWMGGSLRILPGKELYPLQTLWL